MSAEAVRAARRARSSLEQSVRVLEADLALKRDASASRAAVDKKMQKLVDEADRVAFRSRLKQLDHAVESGRDALLRYASEHSLAGVQQTTSSAGARFVRLVAETFPRHVNYTYVGDVDGRRFLWDCGTGLFESRAQFESCLDIAAQLYFGGKPIDVDAVIVSHGHIDHFGDAMHWAKRFSAPIWIHELDAHVLEHFAERTVLTTRDMRTFLQRSGVGASDAESLSSMYLSSKELLPWLKDGGAVVDKRLHHRQELFDGRARLIHTPGHCPGHVCMRVDDVVLVGDQVLAPVTPHLTPQALNPHNGLERYLFGLSRLLLERDVKHVLPAHYEPIPDLHARISEIAESHVEKLRLVHAACSEGATIADVADKLFGVQEGYSVLLALLEAGTHVEYLHQLGGLVVTDIDAVAADASRPLRYVATDVWPSAVDRKLVDVGGG